MFCTANIDDKCGKSRCPTEIFDADHDTALELWAVKLDGVEFVIAVDDGEIGVRATDTNTEFDHFEL